jgi:hypothetical protein
MTGLQLLPSLPVGVLMAVCPLLAASILAAREDKTAEAVELLKGPFDCKRIR